MLASVIELSGIVSRFRERFHLSKAKAAQVLGVSVSYIRSLEEGVDVATSLPFSPREATLRQIATKMSAFGYPMTYEELDAAAKGEIKPMAQQSNILGIKADMTPRLTVVTDLGGQAYPASPEELAIMAEAERLGFQFACFSEPGFWETPPGDLRRRMFRDVEDVIESYKAMMKAAGR